MVESQAVKPYEAGGAASDLRDRRFPKYAITFHVVSLCALLTAVFGFQGIGDNPDWTRFVVRVSLFISVPFVLALVLASVAQPIFSQSRFKQKFYFLLLICALVWGTLLLLGAAIALMIGLGDPFDIVPEWLE